MSRRSLERAGVVRLWRTRRNLWGGSDEREVVIDRGRDCPPVSAGGSSREKQRDGREQSRTCSGRRFSQPMGFRGGAAKCFRGARRATGHAVSGCRIERLERGAGKTRAALRSRSWIQLCPF